MTYKRFRDIVVDEKRFATSKECSNFIVHFMVVVVFTLISFCVISFVCTNSSVFFPLLILVLYLLFMSSVCSFMADDKDDYDKVVDLVRRFYIPVSAISVVLAVVVYIVV